MVAGCVVVLFLLTRFNFVVGRAKVKSYLSQFLYNNATIPSSQGIRKCSIYPDVLSLLVVELI